jgi:tRNA(Ile)-lysidine synthase
MPGSPACTVRSQPSADVAQLPPPVARLRLAVRRCLAALPSSSTVLVACSGGADSLALAASTAFVAPRLGLRAGLVSVDHGLQAGSAARAEAVATWGSSVGLAPAEVATVDVGGLPGGPEAAARSARYAALAAVAARFDASAVLLGHTRDDQAETVLLALARGAGPRGLSGMPYRKGVLFRPLLGVAREDTRKACAALGLVAWEDPHNSDPAYARSRVRADALPALIAALGPGVVDNLARTAAQVAADNAALDALAAAALAAAGAPSVAAPGFGGGGLVVAVLADLAAAVRTRVLHMWARELGAPGGALSHRHIAALDALVTDWHGQGATQLPGDISVARCDGKLGRVGAPDM